MQEILMDSIFSDFNFGLLTKRYPFDWENPIGYSIAVVLQCLALFYLLHYFTCFISIALGAYIITNLVGEFMKNDLKSFNKMAKHKKAKSDLFKSLSQFIPSNAEFKQLSCWRQNSQRNSLSVIEPNSKFILLFRFIEHFSEVYEITIMCMFMGCTISLCLTMLMVQIETVECFGIY